MMNTASENPRGCCDRRCYFKGVLLLYIVIAFGFVCSAVAVPPNASADASATIRSVRSTPFPCHSSAVTIQRRRRRKNTKLSDRIQRQQIQIRSDQQPGERKHEAVVWSSQVPYGGGATDTYSNRRKWNDARSVQCYMLCGARLVQQAMRNTIANVMVYISADPTMTTMTVADKGTVLSAIGIGYLLTQIPGGVLADVLGPKTVMVGSIALSSVCCISIPILSRLSSSLSMRTICLVMMCMGAVQGPLFPASSVMLSRWMPSSSSTTDLPIRKRILYMFHKSQPEQHQDDEKAWGTSMLDIGISLGSMMCIPIVTGIADAVGWRDTFGVVGCIGFAFAALYAVLGSNDPATCWYIGSNERQYLQRVIIAPDSSTAAAEIKETPRRLFQKDKPEAPSSESSSWFGMPTKVLFHPGLWAVFVAHMAFNYSAYFLTNWSPLYYKSVLHMTQKQAQIHLMIPHFAILLIRCTGPALLRQLTQRGVSLLASRKLFTVTGFLLAATCCAPTAQLANCSVWWTTILLALANVGFGLSPTGFKSNYLDITKQYVGVVSGVGNSLGTVASILGPKLTGYTLHKTENNWTIVLATVAMACIVASINYTFFATVTPIEEDDENNNDK